MVKKKQSVILAILGYDKKFEYYLKIKNNLNIGKLSNVKLIYVDNKSGVFYNEHEPINYLCKKKSNEYYEFTGYNVLLEECLKINEAKNYNAIILINDTATNHHFWPLWKFIIRHSLQSTNVGDILGDLREHPEFENNNKFLASWIFIFHVNDLNVFNNKLKLTIDLVSKNIKYYSVDNIEEYATHLEYGKRKRLLDWLFTQSFFRGWTESAKFLEMEKLTRYRKGVTIELEHTLSDSLKQASFKLVDIKKIYFWTKVVNYLDRLINQFQRFKNKFIKFKW